MIKQSGYIKIIMFFILMLIVGIPVISSADEREHRRGVVDELGFRPVEESNRCDQPLLRLKLPKGFKAEAIIDTTRPEQATHQRNTFSRHMRYLMQPSQQQFRLLRVLIFIPAKMM